MFLDAAFHLCQFGFKVFPIAAGAKIPAVPKAQGGRGCLDATDDEEVICGWARNFPRSNIGIACGLPSKVIVIDFDPRNGSDDSVKRLAAKKQLFPATVTARTANGGIHMYYAYEAELKNSKSALAPGIDVKTTGGYVVAPPSRLDGGKAYSWAVSPLGDCFPRLPKWAIEALKPRPAPVQPYNSKDGPKDIQKLVDFVAGAGEGNRNKALFWAVCRAVESGQLDSAGETAFTSAALACGLDKTETVKTISSAKTKARAA